MVGNLIPSFELMLLAGLVCSYHTANSQRDMALENLRQYFPHTDSYKKCLVMEGEGFEVVPGSFGGWENLRYS